MADATQVKRRRGTASQCDAMTPADGEIVVDTTNDRLRVGDGVKLGGFHVPNSNDVQGQSMVFVNAAGTANAITGTYAPALTAYTNGMKLGFKATANNSGATTFNANGLGDIAIQKTNGSSLVALEGGEVINGQYYELFFNGSTAQLVNVNIVPQSGALILLDTKAATGATDIVFSTGFSSDYDNYLLVASQVVRAGSGGVIRLEHSNNAGSGWQFTQNIATGLGTTAYLTGNINFYNMNSSSAKAILANLYIANGLANNSDVIPKAYFDNSTGSSVNAVRLLAFNGVFNSGTVSLYGYAK